MHDKGFSQNLWCTANVYEVLALVINKMMEEIRKDFLDDKCLICTQVEFQENETTLSSHLKMYVEMQW